VGLLTAAPGIDRLLPRETPLPSFDVHAPLLSLPGIFRTTLDSIPSTVPYVAVDNSLVKHWQEVLADLADKSTPNGRSIRVGIAWQGSRTNIHDRQRSFALSHFTRLAEISGVQLISLQQGWGAEQLRDPDLPFQVTELPSREGEELLPFAHVAAVMKNLDLIISCDSANAHLAGALGVPVWIALSFGCDWRWLLRREDNPWYPTARLFRQSRRGAWEEVFERMAQQLGLVTPR
jgi:hypothetical protein